MALGAIEALKDQGIDPASVPVVGIDAFTVDGRQAVKDGTLARQYSRMRTDRDTVRLRQRLTLLPELI